jgi:DNA-binding transcriptional LysR family regulator
VASLEQLRTFLAVYRSGTMTAAATALHLSQPSVSAHLHALEEEVGTPLFNRHARGVEPTARGRILARSVSEPLDQLAAVEAGLVAGRVQDTVVLGGPRDLVALRALPALTGLIGTGVRLRLRTAHAEDLVELLVASELDVAIAVRQPRRTEVVYEPLFTETLVLVGAPSWRARIPARCIRDDPAAVLEDVPWLALGEDLPFITEYCRLAFGGWSPTSVAAATVGDLRALARLAQAEAGLTVLPEYVVEHELAAGTLIRLHEPPDAPRQEVALAYRPRALSRPGVSAVREALRFAATWD